VTLTGLVRLVLPGTTPPVPGPLLGVVLLSDILWNVLVARFSLEASRAGYLRRVAGGPRAQACRHMRLR
jgi:hypothetical protein